MLRIEADADQMRFAAQERTGRDLPINRCEVARYAGAEIGQRAARVDESHEQRLAFELCEVNRPAILVAEREIGHGVARLRHVIEDGRFVIGLALRDHDDVVEQNIGVGIG